MSALYISLKGAVRLLSIVIVMHSVQFLKGLMLFALIVLLFSTDTSRQSQTPKSKSARWRIRCLAQLLRRAVPPCGHTMSPLRPRISWLLHRVLVRVLRGPGGQWLLCLRARESMLATWSLRCTRPLLLPRLPPISAMARACLERSKGWSTLGSSDSSQMQRCSRGR